MSNEQLSIRTLIDAIREAGLLEQFRANTLLVQAAINAAKLARQDERPGVLVKSLKLEGQPSGVFSVGFEWVRIEKRPDNVGVYALLNRDERVGFTLEETLNEIDRVASAAKM